MNPLSLVPGAVTTYKVSELAEILRALLEDSLPSVWVEGEISNFSRPASGHWYFTLKDGSAQLRCAMFKNRNFPIRPIPRDGDVVRVRASVSLYTGRGELQLICEAMEAAGEGALLAAFEKLKKKLAAEGLFDAARKRPLPLLPRNIGVITSATGAAMQDIRATLARRFPMVGVWLYPVPVQGAEAPAAIIKALRELPTLAPIDVLILARGGGSLEDLWAFNDEGLARAVADCAVPVVSGVGHEVDFSLADFAADLRAATPTAAAEAVTPDVFALASQVEAQRQRLELQLAGKLTQVAGAIVALEKRLLMQSPARRLQQQSQRVDEVQERLQRAGLQSLLHCRHRWLSLSARLSAANPSPALAEARASFAAFQQRLQQVVQTQAVHRQHRLGQMQARLASLNPAAVLARGYAIVSSASGATVADTSSLKPNMELHLRFARGSASALVTRINS